MFVVHYDQSFGDQDIDWKIEMTDQDMLYFVGSTFWGFMGVFRLTLPSSLPARYLIRYQRVLLIVASLLLMVRVLLLFLMSYRLSNLLQSVSACQMVA